jgi:glyoxylase-like metal-dependent hydrolase (beta-lactamase superfamily II)
MSKQFNIEYIGTPQIDMDISQKNEIILGKMKFHILHTPGHTPGSVCYFINGILFSGDTLFYHSVGRTDLPRSDADLLNRSVKETLFVLPDETVVYPGHMNSTTILEEKKSNPFII